jgi:hypothetical protein
MVNLFNQSISKKNVLKRVENISQIVGHQRLFRITI